MEQLLPWLRLQYPQGLGRAGLIRLINHYQTPEKAVAEAAGGWAELPRLRQGLASSVPAENDPRVLQAWQCLEDMGARLHIGAP